MHACMMYSRINLLCSVQSTLTYIHMYYSEYAFLCILLQPVYY